jgi:4-alpha-glucanotransferase
MTPANNKLSLDQRQAGVLLHISSLPSPGYIGDLGDDAIRMVDVLAEMGMRVWQTLPINMPHADHSPYQCISAFAGNTEFISLEQLAKQQLLSQADIDAFYAENGQNKTPLLAKTYHQFVSTHNQTEFITFCQQEASWLDDFALFSALRNQFEEQSWHTWPLPFKNRDEVTLAAARLMLAQEIAIIQFAQFIFFSQWNSFKTYAASKDVLLFGDIPIFVAYDSAEVWANPQLFKLDADKNMTAVAGVPPDYFSETGQRWGNPHYAWDKMAEDDYAWWVARLAKQSALFDLVRIDHFRGLEAAWEIAASEETAMHGAWVLAPGDALLAAIYRQLPDIHLVAEDLGIITPEVDALRLKYALPGMKILQFAFGGDQSNPYLPENIEEGSVVYTGTHDNDTTLGWYRQAEAHVKAHLHQYLDQENPEMPMALVKLALSTRAYLAIVPMQDILELDSDCRMNTPGTIVNNWTWRFDWAQLSEAQYKQFAALVLDADRAYEHVLPKGVVNA